MAITPVTSNQPARFSQRDPHGFDAMPPPPLHAKEIAADDFSRQSRDNRNGASNQLFNAHSGQYEPVKEQRRASMRKDQNSFRAHSVLQRPQPGESHGPAEPSPAFQTQRTSTGPDSSHWNRRRASSSISGESGNADRRASLGQTPDLSRFSEDPRHRRGSQLERVIASSGIQGTGSNRSISPAESRGRPAAEAASKSSRQGSSNDLPMPSPRLSKVMQDATGTASIPSTPYQDAAAMTADIKKVMREKAEAALKHRQEEEAKEEAARRERIRIKMEAMGFTDDKMGKKEAASLPKQASLPETPTVIEKKVDEKVAETAPTLAPVNAELPKVNDQPPAKKMIEPRPVNGIRAQVNEMVAEVKSEASALQPFTETESTTSLNSPQPTTNGTFNKRSPLSSQLPSPENRQTNTPQESTQQAWPSTVTSTGLPDPGPVTDWSTTGAPSGMTTHSSTSANLWGPPPHQRALGNGDFNSSVERLQPRNQQYQQQHLPPLSPQPIGPPRAQQLVPTQPSISKVPDGFPQPRSDISQPINRHQPGAMAITEAFQHQVPRQDARNISDAKKYTKPTFSQSSTGSTPSAWAQFAATVERDEAAQDEAIRRERAARAIEDAKKGVAAPELNISALNQTWRKVSTGNEADGRRTAKAKADEATVNGLATMPITEEAPRVASKSPNSSATGSNLPTAPPIRSKFFPFGQASPSPVSRVSLQATTASRTVSPPPPESDDHPAYVGFKGKPFVNLPKPIPTVRLPPSLTTIKEVPVVVEAALQEPKPQPPPIASSTNWQDRFDGLFNRQTPLKQQSPEKRFANVESSSKVPLELTSLDNDAIITLPILSSQLPPAMLPTNVDALKAEAPKVQAPKAQAPRAEAPKAQAFKAEAPKIEVPKAQAPMVQASKVNDRIPETKLVIPTSNTVEEEEALFEEDREMGSKPTVRLPDRASSGGWNVAKTKTNRPRPQKLPAEIESQSKLPPPGDEYSRYITVLIRGMPRPKHMARRGQQNNSPRYAHQQQGMRSQQGPNSPNSARGRPNHRGRLSKESNGSMHTPNTPTQQRPAAPRNAMQTGYPQVPTSHSNPGMSWSRVATNNLPAGRV